MLYIYVNEDSVSSPQTIPFGFDDKYDWDIISNEEKENRGWVAFEPPEYNVYIEEVTAKYIENVLEYVITPLPLTATVILYFKKKISQKRWEVETGGIYVEGIPFKIPTTSEAIAKIDSVLAAYSQGYLAEDAEIDFNVGENTAKANLTVMKKIREAIVNHTQSCHSKQAAMYNDIDGLVAVEGNAHDAQAAFDEVINTGWSNYLEPVVVKATKPTK